MWMTFPFINKIDLGFEVDDRPSLHMDGQWTPHVSYVCYNYKSFVRWKISTKQWLNEKNMYHIKTWCVPSNLNTMEKEEIFAMFILFKIYWTNTIFNCIQGICMALTLEEDSQVWLNYANALQQQENAVFRFLRYAASSGKKDKDVS